jgi:hypothetical protein
MHLNELRPIFFRIEGSPTIHSGWAHLQQRPNNHWFDIYALASDLREYSQAVMATELELAFRLAALEPNDDGLVLVPNSQPALLIGERVKFVEERDLFPSDFIEQGERGVIGRRDRTTGAVEVFLELMHHEETVWLQPHQCADMLRAIVKYSDAFTAPAALLIDDFAAA